ncbi:MAG: Undecaprenyl-diphosphatase [uncultured Gemmatimonadaceae bacterium]|uniref:Undecaprenyl-diphosphatase n=1 Tax=uncultured Gemmatimonadaceae bacterium TaxID=246130 RepID=A0A6J4KVW9_9BACT|nr:MAG: Undecaprenyl-diphosphatase [uncultured Gemmatimonadaceae bacterium]
MTLFQAIVLGALQGLAEFLPISSSAHLSLAPWVLGWRDPGLAFDVALHLGTLITLLWYFRHDWVALVRAAGRIAARPASVGDAFRWRRPEPAGSAERGTAGEPLAPVADPADDERRVVLLAVATVPGAVGGLLLNDLAETTFRAPALTAVALIVMGVLLWAADRFAARDRGLGSMGWREALLIGLAQVAALVPGVSRSGSTMTAGRALRFDRPAAARFSFLMSMPITAAAVALKLPEAVREFGITVPFVVGVLTAAVSSWVAIAVLLRYLARHSFGAFALYRVVLGAAVLALVAARR